MQLLNPVCIGKAPNFKKGIKFFGRENNWNENEYWYEFNLGLC